MNTNSKTIHYVYFILSIVFFLTLGIFNSALVNYKQIWNTIILLSCFIFYLFFQYSFNKNKVQKNIGLDIYTLFIIFSVICLIINAFFHHISLFTSTNVIYVNIRKVTPILWIYENYKFLTYYLLFPVLLLFHLHLISKSDPKIIIRITAVILAMSIIVIYYQAMFDKSFLVKWSKLAAVPKSDGLATDPNSYGMSAFLVIPVLIIGFFSEKKFFWKLFFSVIIITLCFSVIFTKSRTVIAALIILFLFLPIIVLIADNRIRKINKILLILTFLSIIFSAIFFIPHLSNDYDDLFKGTVFERLSITWKQIHEYGFHSWFSQTYRALQFKIAWNLIWKAPLAGWGPGGFYRESPNEIFIHTGEYSTRNDSALNHYLMIAGDLGIPTLLINLFLVILPLLIMVYSFLKTNEIKIRYVILTLFVTNIVFLFLINTLPPSYFPDVLWIWTAELAFMFTLGQRVGISIKITQFKRRMICLLICLIIIFPTLIGAYQTTFGKAGYTERQNSDWWLFGKNCHNIEKWVEGKVRWCKKDALLKIQIKKEVPRMIKLNFLLHHPDIKINPVLVKYGIRNKKMNEILVTDKFWKTIHIPVTKGDILKLKTINEKVNKYLFLSFDVSRTWIPKTWKINNDVRELGVAVLIPDL